MSEPARPSTPKTYSPNPLPPQPDASKSDVATKRRSDDNANNPPISDRTVARDQESGDAENDKDGPTR